MPMLIDMHNHTSPASDDSVLTVEDLVRLAKERGLDGVAITDHDYFWDTKKLTPLDEEGLIALGRRHGLLVVPAVEINTDDGHLICFGLERYVFGMHHTSRVKEMVDAVGGAMFLAHPYRRQMMPDETEKTGWRRSIERSRSNLTWKVVDAAEVMNGRGWAVENAFASSIAKEMNVRGVANSDSHKPSDVAACATLFYDDIGDRKDLIQALKAGRFEPVRLNGYVSPEVKEALQAGRLEPRSPNGRHTALNLAELVRV